MLRGTGLCVTIKKINLVTNSIILSYRTYNAAVYSFLQIEPPEVIALLHTLEEGVVETFLGCCGVSETGPTDMCKIWC